MQVVSHHTNFNCSVFNNPPVASNQTVFINANTSVNLTLTGSDVDGDPIAFNVSGSPAHGTLSNFGSITGTVTYTPDADFSGTDSFTFTVNDGAADSALATVSIGVGFIDSVGDGIPNWWRALYFGGSGTTNNAPGSCAACDPDGDGMKNVAEFLAGTDPTNSTSSLRIISVVPQDGDVAITWSSAGGKTNILQTASGRYTNNFVDIVPSLSIIAGSGDAITNYLDVGAATNEPARFYRVRLAP